MVAFCQAQCKVRFSKHEENMIGSLCKIHIVSGWVRTDGRAAHHGSDPVVRPATPTHDVPRGSPCPCHFASIPPTISPMKPKTQRVWKGAHPTSKPLTDDYESNPANTSNNCNVQTLERTQTPIRTDLSTHEQNNKIPETSRPKQLTDAQTKTGGVTDRVHVDNTRCFADNSQPTKRVQRLMGSTLCLLRFASDTRGFLRVGLTFASLTSAVSSAIGRSQYLLHRDRTGSDLSVCTCVQPGRSSPSSWICPPLPFIKSRSPRCMLRRCTSSRSSRPEHPLTKTALMD